MSHDPDRSEKPKLTLPAVTSLPEPEEYRAFGGAEYYDAVIPCLVLRMKDGGRLAKPYHWLGEVDYDPSIGIRLVYSDTTILIRGRNLESLFTAISDHTVHWIREADRPTAFGATDGLPLVESIERNPRGR